MDILGVHAGAEGCLRDGPESQRGSRPPGTAHGAVLPNWAVALTRDAPDDDSITGYRILRRRPGHGEDELLMHNGNTGSKTTSYVDTEVAAGTEYVYAVQTARHLDTGAASNPATVTTPAQ